MAYVSVKRHAIKMWEGNLNLTVQNKMFTGKVNMAKKSDATTGNVPAASGMSLPSNSNPLVDMNYGRLLVKDGNTAFTGGARSATTLGKAISNLLFKIDIGDVCLITKKVSEGKKLMLASIDAFGDLPPGKARIIANSGFENTFAVRRISNKKQELINLADEPIIINSGDGKTRYTIGKGEYLPLIAGDSIITKKGSIEIPLMNEIGFNKPKVGNDLERFAEEGPAYKVGYGAREPQISPCLPDIVVKGFVQNK